MLQQVYPDYSKVEIKLDTNVVVTLKFWKCFRVKNGDIITYSLSDEYVADPVNLLSCQDPDYAKFISYLKVDTTDEFWWTRCGQVISEEEMTSCCGDVYSVYKFHYLTQTAEGDIMTIIPFNPIEFDLRQDYD